jgi:muramoyltetrapeptide carboxypeptidase LdcA involved in peptidoglycan recycling
MDGFVIVNTKENRLVEISGTLTHGVLFGGGLFGHLDAGGSFDVHREELEPGHWAVTRLKVNMNGKALFFKTIAEHQDEVHSHFKRIPDTTTLEQAEAMAQKQSAAPAASGN